MIEAAALFQNELEDIADMFVRAKDVSFYYRFADLLNQARVGEMRRVIDQHCLATGSEDFVDDARRGRNDIHVVLAPQPFLDDLHVEQAEKTAAKSEAKRDRTFRLINEG